MKYRIPVSGVRRINGKAFLLPSLRIYPKQTYAVDGDVNILMNAGGLNSLEGVQGFHTSCSAYVRLSEITLKGIIMSVTKSEQISRIIHQLHANC